MIYHPLRSLVGAGITDILVVTGVEHIGDVVCQLRSGDALGCRLTYRCQDDPLGIANALLQAEDFSRGEPVVVILGDNIFEHPLSPLLERYRGTGAQIHLKTVDDPRRFGVARLEGDQLLEIIEKPEHPPSNHAVTGLYCFDGQVYDIIRTLQPSQRGEYEISDVHTAYIHRNQMQHAHLTGYWSDAGTHASLQHANRLMMRTPCKD